MILKDSDGRDEDLACLGELLLRAKSSRQRADIENEIKAIQRGAKGELETAYILNRTYGHSENTMIIHDLRICDGLGGYVQFDHLLFNRVLKRIAVLESKNYSGRLSRNEHAEWCVWYPGRRVPVDIPNPVAQAQRAARLLEIWLKTHKHQAAFRQIEGWAIIPPTCQLDRTRIGKNINIAKADLFQDRWLEDASLMDLTGLVTGLSKEQLAKLGKQLVSQHVPAQYDWAKRFGVDETEQTSSSKLPVSSKDPSSPPKPIEAIATQDGIPTPSDGQEKPTAAEVYHDYDYSAPATHELKLEDGEATAIVSDAGDVPLPSVKPKGKTKASPLVEIAQGVSERTLPDGRIAFVITQTGSSAADRVSTLCKGRAKWSPMFRNWVCDDALALEVRDELQKYSEVAP